MKSTKIAILTTALLSTSVLMSGAASANDSGVGTWTLGYDWYCDGNYSKTTMTLNADGTFTTGSYSGDWFTERSFITVRFSTGTTYTGTHIHKSMTGAQKASNGLRGCWYAHPNDSFNYNIEPYDTTDSGVDPAGNVGKPDKGR